MILNVKSNHFWGLSTPRFKRPETYSSAAKVSFTIFVTKGIELQDFHLINIDISLCKDKTSINGLDNSHSPY